MWKSESAKCRHQGERRREKYCLYCEGNQVRVRFVDVPTVPKLEPEQLSCAKENGEAHGNDDERVVFIVGDQSFIQTRRHEQDEVQYVKIGVIVQKHLEVQI